MTKKQTSLLALLSALLVLVFLLLQAQPDFSGVLERDEASAPSARAALLPETTHVLPGEFPAAGERTRVQDSSLPEQQSVEQSKVLATDRQTLAGTVVDGSHNPLAGVQVQLCVRTASDGARMDFRARQELRIVESAASQADGTFHFDLPVGVPHLLRIAPDAGAGRASVELSPCYAGQTVTLLVPLGGRVEGRVLTAQDGQPVEGALVRLWGDRESAFGPLRSGLDGRFVFADLPPGSYVCQVFPREQRRAPSLQFTIVEGATSQITIEVEPGLALRGRITNAETGAPLEGAVIREGYVSPRDTARSNAAGEYELRGVGWQLRTTIYVEADGFGAAEALAPVTGESEAWLNFELTPGGRATGRVLGPDGAPLEGVNVGAAARDTGTNPGRIDWRSDLTDREGRFEIRGIRKEMQHVLQLSKRGYGSRFYDFPTEAPADTGVRFGDLHLFSAARLEGRVVHEDGTPVPNATVRLIGANRDRFRFGRLGLDAAGVEFYVTRTERGADPDGVFHFGSLSDGEWTLSARLEGSAGEAAKTVQLKNGETLDSVELVVPLGSSLAGRVVDPGGRGIAGAWVSCQESGGRVLRAESGEDGAYRLLGLLDESYDLRLRAPFVDRRESSSGPRYFGTWLPNVSVGQTDLELQLVAAVTLRGRVLGEDGEPLALAWVQLHDAELRFLSRVIADQEGRFEMEAPQSHGVRVSASASIPDERTVSGRSQDSAAPVGALERVAGEGGEWLVRIP